MSDYKHTSMLMTEHEQAMDVISRKGRDALLAEIKQLKAEIARSTEREIHQLAEIEVLRKIATELRRWASCEHVHHDKRDQHEFDEPCKVLERIDAAMSKEKKD